MTETTKPDSDYKSRAIETELIYGALIRAKKAEKHQYYAISLAVVAFLLCGIGFAFDRDPPPILVAFDPSTGFAIPEAFVATKKVAEQEAVIQANVYAYIKDRETYDQLANDKRVPRALSRSGGRAKASLNQLWSADSTYYPPKRYGANAVLEVNVLSITQLGNNRSQVRIVKKLTQGQERTSGSFTAILKYEFKASEIRDLEAVWNNPFGFTVTEYSITPDKKGKI